jgi:hypothetical protein
MRYRFVAVFCRFQICALLSTHVRVIFHPLLHITYVPTAYSEARAKDKGQVFAVLDTNNHRPASKHTTATVQKKKKRERKKRGVCSSQSSITKYTNQETKCMRCSVHRFSSVSQVSKSPGSSPLLALVTLCPRPSKRILKKKGGKKCNAPPQPLIEVRRGETIKAFLQLRPRPSAASNILAAAAC